MNWKVHAFAWVLGLAGPVLADEFPPLSAFATDIDRVVSPYLEAGDFMGVIAVQRADEMPLFRSYKLASVEQEVPHRAEGIFLIGSISKQFTAAAILLLEQDGELNTSDPVRLYLPDFKPDEPITIEHLLTHTSGIADVFSLRRHRESAGQGGTFENILKELDAMSLTHAPGAAFSYSNGGYSVLAAVIEQISGMTYGDFLLDRVFRPLGMSSTSHDVPRPAVRHRVSGYDPWGVRDLLPVLSPSSAYTTGSGSLWSSAADLLVWNNALHGGGFLTAASYAKLVHDYGYEYGYGVSVFERFGRDVIGHDGRIAGYASDAARYLEDQITVVVLSNVQSAARDEIRSAVAGLILGEVVEPPEDRTFSSMPADKHLVELSGTYSFGPGFDVTISHSDGRLLARANEGGESELVPMTNGAWFSRMLYATVRFGRDDSGDVMQLIWGPGDNAPVGVRKSRSGSE